MDVIVPCMQGTEDFLYICLQTMIVTAKNPSDLKIYVGIDFNNHKVGHVRDQKILELQKLGPEIEIHKIVTKFPRSSKSHGIVLNTLYQKCTQKYRFVIDSDLAFVYPNWDEVMIGCVSNQSDRICMVGLPYVDERHYFDFPCAMGMLLNTHKMLELGAPEKLDFCPILCHHKNFPMDAIVNQADQHLYRKPVGSQIRFDTGIEVRLLFYKHRLDAIVIPKSVTQVFSRVEFQYQNVPFILHYDGSSKSKFKSQGPTEWVDQIVSRLLTRDQIDVSHLKKLFEDGWFA